MSVPDQIIDVFRDGPGMIADIVLELDLPSRKLSGAVNYLVRAGKLRRRPFHVPPELQKPGKETVWLYYLPAQEVRR